MRKHVSLWLIAGAVMTAPTLAHAEDEPKPYPECLKVPTEAETAAAKGAYQAGNASFDEADYPRAITYWEDAYRRDCTANLLLKNLARAYELYGQKRQAVVALETFLVREPNTADKEQIQRRIEVLKKQITAETAPPVAAAPAPATIAPAQQQPPPPPPEPQGKRSITPLIVAGAGGVVLIVGGVMYGKASKDVNHYEELCPNRDCDSSADPAGNKAGGNSARTRKIWGGVVTGVGAATLAGGLIWYFVQPRQATSSASIRKPELSPALSPGFAGVSLSGAF